MYTFSINIFICKGSGAKDWKILTMQQERDAVAKLDTIVKSNKKAATSTKSSREADSSDDENKVRNCKLWINEIFHKHLFTNSLILMDIIF